MDLIGATARNSHRTDKALAVTRDGVQLVGQPSNVLPRCNGKRVEVAELCDANHGEADGSAGQVVGWRRRR